MKTLAAVFVALIFVTTSHAQSNQPLNDSLAAMQVKIEKMEQDLRSMDIAISKLYWEAYIAMKEADKRNDICIFSYKGFNAKALYDTVPTLRDYHRAYEKADSVLELILQKDKDYNKARTMQRTAVSQGDKDAAKKLYYEVYDRISNSSQGDKYKEARDLRNEKKRERDLAITKYLLRHHQENGMILPTDVIPYSEQRDIRQVHPEINSMQDNRRILSSILSNTKRKYYQEKYGINNDNSGDIVASQISI